MWRPTLLLVLAAGAFGYLIEEDLELLIVQTTTPQQVATLASFEEDYQLDFWTHPALNQWTMVAVPTRRHEELYQTWTNAGMTVNVREPNVLNMIERIKEKDTRYHLANRGKSRTEGLTLDHSRYYRNMLPELTTLKNTFPDLVFFDDSGNTPARSRSQADNRIIHVIELGANRGSTDVIMLEVNIHAREHITAAANLYFMDWVLSNYGSNENATFLLDNYHFVIMPVANPDGYDYSFVSSNTRLWRKNRGVNSGSSCRGTDLNRNFNANWLGGSSTRCSDTYRGASAGSEGESQAVMSVFNAFKDRMKVFMPVHAFSQLLLLPYSYSANPNQAGAKPPNQAKHYAAAIAMSAAMEDATGRFYTWGLPVETINCLGPAGTARQEHPADPVRRGGHVQPRVHPGPVLCAYWDGHDQQEEVRLRSSCSCSFRTVYKIVSAAEAGGREVSTAERQPRVVRLCPGTDVHTPGRHCPQQLLWHLSVDECNQTR